MSHALAPGEAEARRRPFVLSVDMRLRSSSCCFLNKGLSQAFCANLEDSVGCGTPGHLLSHLCRASSRSEVDILCCSMSDIVFATLWREEIKAGKAMSVARRRPRPPRHSGKKHCWYESGDSEQFKIPSIDSLCSSSNCNKSWEQS